MEASQRPEPLPTGPHRSFSGTHFLSLLLQLYAWLSSLQIGSGTWGHPPAVAFLFKQVFGVSKTLALDACPARWAAPKDSIADSCFHIHTGKCRPWAGFSSFCSGERAPTLLGGAGVCVVALLRCPVCAPWLWCSEHVAQAIPCRYLGGGGEGSRPGSNCYYSGITHVPAPLGRAHRSTPGSSQLTREEAEAEPYGSEGCL